MCALYPKRLKQRGDIVRDHAYGDRLVLCFRARDAARVKSDGAKMSGENGNLFEPYPQTVAEARNKDERRTLALLFIIKLSVARLNLRHKNAVTSGK